MRDTIDFGIDLGTTNSAMAVVQDGEVAVVKNNDGWDYTPSAVWIPKPGVMYVGRRARERTERDVDNAHAEFKQEMGLDGVARKFRTAGVSLTPQQLSAEVLKSLRADAAHQFGEAPPAAVITVPAAFRLHQNNATSEAAALAGFGACPLVQEPTAAAFAYGFQNESSQAYWMVFDFGGGTFDAAVVSTHEGELRVLDHAGDPHLGGKLIDWAIVDRVLAPVAAREFGLTGFTRDDPRWVVNFTRLKWAAEEAKISLSRTEKAELLVDIDLEDGQTESLEYALRRDELDRVAEPYYNRAITLCREALTTANLHPSDIDRLLLVGGTTLAPGLRERLADPDSGLGIELDHSQDPSTVVARGAAVFASTVPLDRPKVRPAAGEFGVDLRYPRTTSLTAVTVAGKVEASGAQDLTGYHVLLENSTGRPPFVTGRISLDASGTFVTEVQVNEQTTATFEIRLVGPDGQSAKITPDSISITHWLNEPAGPVLTNSIGLSQADRTFAPILAKGATLPATAREMFHTTVALHRADAAACIRIPIVEGERDRAERNMQVGLIEIRPKDVSIDLPKGSDVEVTIEVDESRRVTVVADVPLVDEQFEAEIDLSNVRPPDVTALQRELREVQQRLDRLRSQVDPGSHRAQNRLDELDSQRSLSLAKTDVRNAATDEGSAAAADARLRDIQAELDEVENDVQLPGRLAELDGAIAQCRELVSRHGDTADRAELADIERRAEQVRREPATAVVDQLMDRVAELETLMMKRDGTLDISIFYWYRANQDVLSQPVKARALIAEGDDAIAERDFRSLPGINQRLRRLLPPEVGDPAQGGVQRRQGTRR
ncbi:Hsp70 family protein [Kibdelosporangium phytohabitans]|uniref:2-alkenal reductase n=1 Tax=Kibdelosporangium phytohabitans TaxID=860235 RepID=A0A0N9I424_9PSEU|nr:Hsp70 family protein [Kibdelosporangium phytohabitans]ALG09550.1 hypothetical protein AOZ06_23965 [Kibdelosporangium phytohabitans]MBE1469133.1 molecular chaperone DnaK [Kibdelosporangium phytohabitans]